MRFDEHGEQIREPEWPGVCGAPGADTDVEDHMVRISKMIADLQKIFDQFGDTCVYIRRGGVSWGAVALNRRADDQKHGVFNLQAQHDRDMQSLLEQIERLKADRDSWMAAANYDRTAKTTA
jgi:hypothetical protein